MVESFASPVHAVEPLRSARDSIQDSQCAYSIACQNALFGSPDHMPYIDER